MPKKSHLFFGLLALGPLVWLPVHFAFRAKPEKKSNSLPDAVLALTNRQMHEDFDTLAKIITEVDPRIGLRKRLMGLDTPEQLRRLRSQVDTCQTDESFRKIIRRALAMCQDGHNSLLPHWFFQELDSVQQAKYLETFAANRFTPAGVAATRAHVRSLDSLASLIKLDIPLTYREGDYYLVAAFVCQGRTIPAGLKLTRFNGQDIHRFVAGLYMDKVLHWDMKRHRFYDDRFYKAPSLALKKTLSFTFQQTDGREMILNLDPRQPVTTRAKVTTPYKTVDYFDDKKILYVRIPIMDPKDTAFYIEQIREKGQGKPIAKVIIDIRGNPGGSDVVGIRVLESLIYEPISIGVLLAGKPSAYARKRLGREPFPLKAPSVGGDTLAVWYEWREETRPSKNSLGFNGRIYILQDEEIYSAAGTLAAFATYSEKIVSVGQPTGRPLGRGIDPMIFMLPHSGLLFRIEPVIDLSGVSSLADAFHDRVEVYVPLSPTDLGTRVRYGGNVYSKDFLYRIDPVFEKILAMP